MLRSKTKKFSGEGALPDPSPHPTLIGAFGASTRPQEKFDKSSTASRVGKSSTGLVGWGYGGARSLVSDGR